MILTKRQVAALWIEEGGPPDEAGRAAEVATRESSRNTSVVNSIGAVGLMQIYDGHYPSASRIRELQNPRQNMREAVGKYHAAGGWSPWVVCGSRNDCPTIPKTANVALAGGSPNMDVSLLGDLWGRLKGSPGLGGHRLPNDPLAPGGPLVPDIPDPLAGLQRLVELMVNIVKKIADPATWLNAGKILLGFILLTMALRRLFTMATT